MGRTKALIEVAGAPMASAAITALRGAGCVDVVLVGGDADELDVLGVPVVGDRHPGEGPLGGVLTALERVDDGDLVAVLACDLPDIGAGDLEPLFCALDADPGVAVAMARTDRLQSTVAVWRAVARHALRRAFDRGERALHRSIVSVPVAEIRVRAGALHNVNTPADLPGESPIGS